jgi:PilZ domain
MNYLQSILCLDSEALAALEQHVIPPVEPHPDTATLALLSAQVETAATFAAVTASVANALADPRAPKVNVHALTTYAPPDVPAFGSDAQLLALTTTIPGLAGSIQDFGARLGLSKRMADAFIRESTTSGHARSIAPEVLADAWSKTCASALRLVRTLSDTGPGQAASAHDQRFDHLCHLLEDAQGRRHPCVEADGCVVVPGWAERRRQPRVSTNLPAEIQFGPVTYDISIVDVSQGGLGLDGNQVLLAGDVVSVLIPDGRSLKGRIAWVAGTKAGLELADPLAPDDPLLRHGPSSTFALD